MKKLIRHYHNPTFLIREGTNDEHAYNEVFVGDVYRMFGLFNKDDLILDIGSHIGSFARLMYDKFGCRNIMAFEPLPDNFRVLQANIRDTTIKIFNNAVYSEETDIMFSGDFQEGNTTITSHHSIYISGPKEIKIHSLKFDDIIEDKLVRFIKMDCEGSEYPILYRSKKLNQIQEIRMEYHNFDSSEFKANGESLADFLRENGFAITKLESWGNLAGIGEVGYLFAKRI
jgi:FkbM family methyltransferase